MLFCVTQVHYKNGGKNADAGGKQQKDDPCEYTGLPALNKPQVRDAVVKKDISHDNSHKHGAQKRKAINSKFCVPRFLALVFNGFRHLLHAALKVSYANVRVMKLLLML